MWTPRASSFLVLSGLFATQIAGIAAARIPRHGLAPRLALITAGLAFGLQLCIAWRGGAGWSGPRRLVVLLLLGSLTYLPLAAFGMAWPGMAGFFAGSVLMLWPARKSWVMFTCIMVSMLVAALVLGMSIGGATYLTSASLSSGLTVFALYQIRRAGKRAQGAGARHAQLASVRERERFSRDLHDILGYSLSAITLKAELTRKLVDSNPALARDELTEVVELARQAALDVRLIASGYGSISLTREAASAASLLSAACITPRIAINCGVLDDKVDEVLAIVLREAVTNVLRHSAARSCTIEAAQEDKLITLVVINDGVRRLARPGTGGHGLRNLTRRLEAIGGELSTDSSDGDQFSLLATVPTQEAPRWRAGPLGQPSTDRVPHGLGGSQSLRGGKPGLGGFHFRWRRLKIGQGEQDGQVGRPPRAQLDHGGDDGIGADRYWAGPADEYRPASPRLGVRVVRYCYRTDEPRTVGHSRQPK